MQIPEDIRRCLTKKKEIDNKYASYTQSYKEITLLN